VLGASIALGVNVATVPVASSARLPVTAVLPATTWSVVEPLTTARSNPTDTVVPSAIPVALGGGDCDATDGATAVVNDHVTGVIDAPAGFVAPEPVTV
jgi:hypothetical protein